jgi:hypothetical protein
VFSLGHGHRFKAGGILLEEVLEAFGAAESLQANEPVLEGDLPVESDERNNET